MFFKETILDYTFSRGNSKPSCQSNSDLAEHCKNTSAKWNCKWQDYLIHVCTNRSYFLKQTGY